MVRSLKKGPFISHGLLNEVKHMRENGSKQIIVTQSRCSTIIPTIIGNTVSIHNGNDNIPVFIIDQIVGHKLGEFAATRTLYKTRKLGKKNKRSFYGTKSSPNQNSSGKHAAFELVLVQT